MKKKLLKIELQTMQNNSEINNWLIPIATGLIGWLAKSIHIRFVKKEDRHIQNDIELYKLFKNDFPSNNGFITKLIDRQRYGGSLVYLRGDLFNDGDVYYFDIARQWKSPERKFHNIKIDGIKNEFLDFVLLLDKYIGKHYKDTGQEWCYQKIGKWDQDYQEPPEQDKIILDKIDKTIDAIIEAHIIFIKTAQKM